MSDDFMVNTEELTSTANMIKKDTDTLRGQTTHQIDQIDSAGQNLPGSMYTMLLPMLGEIKAYLNRSMDIRDRISTVLGEVAKAVEQEENQIKQQFTQLTPSGTRSSNHK